MKLGFITFVVLLLSTSASACYQIDDPSVTVRARVLTGKATLNGEAIKGARLELFQILRDGKKLIRNAKSNDRGEFDFGSIEVGKYELQMISPSHETLKVTVLPQSTLSADRVHLKYYADFCHAYGTYS